MQEGPTGLKLIEAIRYLGPYITQQVRTRTGTPTTNERGRESESRRWADPVPFKIWCLRRNTLQKESAVRCTQNTPGAMGSTTTADPTAAAAAVQTEFDVRSAAPIRGDTTPAPAIYPAA